MLVGWLCFTSHRQQGHLETSPPFTVPCEGREAWFLRSPIHCCICISLIHTLKKFQNNLLV